MAGAFLEAPAATAQRLVRAKVKIKAAAIPFEVPERHNWQERLSFVVERMGRRRGAL